MKNSCKFSEKMYMYIDNQLDEQQKAKLFEHIENCSLCKQEFKMLNIVKNEFNVMKEVKIPKEYHQKLHMKLVKLTNEANTIKNKSYMRLMNRFVPVVAAVLIVFVTVKGITLFNVMNEDGNNLAGSSMDMVSSQINDGGIKNEALMKSQEAPRAMKIAGDTVQNNNKTDRMSSSAGIQSIEASDLKAYNDPNASVKDMKATRSVEPPTNITTDAQDTGELTYGLNLDKKMKGLQNMKAEKYGFETIVMDKQTGIEKQQNIIVQNQEDFKKLWELTYKYDNPIPVIPEVDFEKYIIAAAFMGQKSTGGYGIEITEVEENEKNVVITVKQTSPPEGSFVIEVLTSPGHIVKIKKTDKEIIFNK